MTLSILAAYRAAARPCCAAFRPFNAFALLFLIFGGANLATAQTATATPYRFTVDLTKVKDDKLTVELTALPDVAAMKDAKELTYHIPKIVPGTYAIYDFGRFVTGFKALNAKGKELTVEHPDANTWVIKKAKKLARITYDVEDSFDSEKQNLPFEPAGSNIDDANYVLNNHAFFGYFEGFTKLPYEVTVKRPATFFGATSLKRTSSSKDTDVFTAETYNALVDGPIMFSTPDTAMIRVGNADILIAVYSPSKKVSAKFVSSQIAPTLNAQKNYLGGNLPVDHYAFIIYLTDGATATGNFGALEHSYSSFYVLPELEPEQIAQTVRDVAAHEFFHVVTPLNIHSYEIADFDFINPKMSEHLWLYEGTTEYKASHVQVQAGMMPLEQYLEVLSDKVRGSRGNDKFDDKLSFTAMSRDVLVKYKEQYNNVYEKGTLIGLCLDLTLRRNSDGKYTLNKLMDDLAKEYGKNKAFKDEELFDKIIMLSHQPALKSFFRDYVEGGTPLPIKECLGWAGIDFYDTKRVKDFSLGGLEKCMGLNQESGKFYIKTTANLDEFGKTIGLEKDDVIEQWNGKAFTMESLEPVITAFVSNLKEGDTLTLKVMRGGKDKTLATQVIKVEGEKPFVIEPTPTPTPEQLAFRKGWLANYVTREEKKK